MSTFLGDTDGAGRRFGIVVARFNEIITKPLLEGARTTLERAGAADIDVAEVPGARELPLAVQSMARTGRYAGVVAIGCVMRGETSHYEYVAGEASSGLGRIATESGVPIGFGVLTTENLEQAFHRAGGKLGNAGSQAALVVLEMAGLLERIEKDDPR